jgi:hypothetical protein
MFVRRGGAGGQHSACMLRVVSSILEWAQAYLNLGVSVAKWLAHLPFTSEATGSSLSENFLNATRTQSSCEKSKSQRSAESRGFPPGTPVSSHRESWQGGLGKKGPQ